MSNHQPTHEVYVVVDAPTGEKDRKARWTKIGVGFCKDGGMTLLLDAAPIYPRIVVRPVKAPAMKGGAQ